MIPMRIPATLFLITALLYALMAYGGIRSPDNEVVFRAGVSLVEGKGGAVSDSLETWQNFGLATGKDGREYAVFGPLASAFWSPFIATGEAINKTRWYTHVLALPPSHYVGNGMWEFVKNVRPSDPEPHALRTLASLMNVLAGAGTAMLFWLLLFVMTGEANVATATSLLYAFGTLAWPYSGTCFSEPMALFWIVASLFLMIRCAEPCARQHTSGRPLPMLSPGRQGLGLFFSGITLALATGTHISAILFAPFFSLYVLLSASRSTTRGRGLNHLKQKDFRKCGEPGDSSSLSSDKKDPNGRGLIRLLSFVGGYTLPMLWLAYTNFSRFGNILETGRGVNPERAFEFGYGTFQAPWEALHGLLLSPGKGLFLFSPAVLLGCIVWPSFHRRYKLLSTTLLLSIVGRLLFVATRSDWHGGFSLGPRLMLMVLPLLILPVGVWLEEKRRQRQWSRIHMAAFFCFVCVAQQIYFCLGEIFSFSHIVRNIFLARGVELTSGNLLYTRWEFSPLFFLLEFKRGPFLLQWVPLGNLALWDILVLLAGLGLALFYIRWYHVQCGGNSEGAPGGGPGSSE